MMYFSKSAGSIFFRVLLAIFPVFSYSLPAHSQANSAAPAPDVILFTNGDQLTGKLLREVNGSVTFHSDIAGDVTVPWAKIKSIRSSQQFAVIQQGQHISRKTPDTDVPQGVVQVEDEQVKVAVAAGGATKDIPVKNAQYMIDEATYDKELRRNPGFLYGWSGSITAGATLVEATQNSRNFTGGATLVRAIPTANWLDRRNRTTFDFTGADGTVTQPGTVETKTNIIHLDAEHDWYFSPRFYYLVDSSFDHNYSQGLNLQQIYGIGVGSTILKKPKQQLDVKFDIHYEKQQYFVTPNVTPPPPLTPSTNLIGADFGDTYMLKLPLGLVFNQTALLSPAFNQAKDYSAVGGASLVFPVFKRLGFSVGALDNFLNDPAIGSKKNSFQFTAGVNYTLK